jgi:hypothetical protein
MTHPLLRKPPVTCSVRLLYAEEGHWYEGDALGYTA